MNHLLNHMRVQAAGAIGGIDQPRVGIVKNYDPDTYSCRVLLQPDGTLTGWLPISSVWVGNGWGMFSPPVSGTAVSVIPVDGSLESAYVLTGTFNDSEKPVSVPQGEFWLVHASGAAFQLRNDGSASFSDGNGATVTLDGSGQIKSTGQWEHQGDMTVSGSVKGTTVSDAARRMSDDRMIFNIHTHTTTTPGNQTSPTATQE